MPDEPDPKSNDCPPAGAQEARGDAFGVPRVADARPGRLPDADRWPSNDSLRPVDISLFGAMTPMEVLYEFDGPRIFTFETPSGSLLLGYLCEKLEDSSLLRYIVAKTTSGTVAAMKRGMASVRHALEQESLWLVDMDFGLAPQQAFVVSLDQLPGDALPPAKTLLWAEREPTDGV